MEVDASRREVIDIFTSENFIEMSLIFSCTYAEIGQTDFGGSAMSTFLPQDVQAGLDAARIKALRKSSRLKIKTDLESFRVLRLWDNGFSLEAGTAPGLRGLVDIYDGGLRRARFGCAYMMASATFMNALLSPLMKKTVRCGLSLNVTRW